MRFLTQSRTITLVILLAAGALGAFSLALEMRAVHRVREAMSIRAFITRLNTLELGVLDYEEAAAMALAGDASGASVHDAHAVVVEFIASLRASEPNNRSAIDAMNAIERELAASWAMINESLTSDDPPSGAAAHAHHLASVRALREIRHAVNDQRTRLIGDVQEIAHAMALIRTLALLSVGLAVFIALQSVRVQRAALRLRESEERHRALFESSRDAIVVTDDDGRYLQANNAAAELFGYPRERLLSMRVSDLRVPDDDPAAGEQYAVYLRTGNESGEFCFIRADGERRTAEYAARRIAQNVHMSIMRDVTDRLRAEAELREALERFQCAVKATEDVVWDWDIIADEMRWSDAFTEVYGYHDTVIRPAAAWIKERIHPDDRSRVERSIYDVLDGLAHHWECEYRFRRADGSHAIVFDRGYVLRDERGKPVRMIGAMIDFTQRRAQQESLLTSEERYRLATLATMDAVWDWDLTSDVVVWNRAIEDRFGHTLDTVEQTGAWWLQRVHPEDRDWVKQSIFQVINGHEPHWEEEYRFQRADGSYAVVVDRGYVSRDVNGRAVRMIGAMNDVTERRRAEDALRESEARFRAIADSSPMLIWVTNRDRQCEYVNRAWLEFSGRSFEEMNRRGWMRGVHPSDVDRMDQHVRAAIRVRRPFSVEFRYRRADGEYRWLVDTGAPRFLDNGEFAGYIGSCIDITERKHAEERLKLLNRELNHRVKNNLAAIQALAERTAENASSLDGFRAAFAGRINALARMHDLALRTPGDGMTLDAVVRLTLEAYDHPPDHAVDIEGAPIIIGKAAAAAINMIVHELATNAVKHGALSTPRGSVRIRWDETPDGVRIVWTEHGGPTVVRPATTGFGFEMIEGTARHELNGRVAWDFQTSGLRCTIDIPASSIAPSPTDERARVPITVKE